jgi:hypothetical protein
MATSLNVTLVMASGKVDQDATRDAFETAMSQFVAQHETESATLSDAVTSVLAAHPGKGIAMPILASLALASINVQPENYSVLSEQLLNYVRRNASDNRADGKPFRIGKGKGGGVRSWSDIPVEAPAAK